jgi:hypothetical protein
MISKTNKKDIAKVSAYLIHFDVEDFSALFFGDLFFNDVLFPDIILLYSKNEY